MRNEHERSDVRRRGSDRGRRTRWSDQRSLDTFDAMCCFCSITYGRWREDPLSSSVSSRWTRTTKEVERHFDSILNQSSHFLLLLLLRETYRWTSSSFSVSVTSSVEVLEYPGKFSKSLLLVQLPSLDSIVGARRLDDKRFARVGKSSERRLDPDN